MELSKNSYFHSRIQLRYWLLPCF